MRLIDLNIDGFGVLSQLRLDDLQPGLNVVHGPNGSGKTTLLHFLRGVWCGFEDSRRRRFLPPLSGGHPGGDIEVARGERRYHITRQALPNGTDRLAVSIRRGTLDDTGSLRGMIEALSPDLVHSLYAVGGNESHAIDRLLELAARDGISLQSQRRRSTKFDERLTEVRRRRETLLGGDGVEGETPRLRTACQQAQSGLQSLQADANRLQHDLTHRFADVIAELDRLANRVEWLDLECQALQSNLIETEGKTVAGPAPAPAPVANSIVVECHTQDDVRDRVRELDRRIAQARAVLEDLARSRMRVSVEKAQMAGIDTAALLDNLRQQRESLRALEQEALLLRTAADQLANQSAAGCHCGDYQTRIHESTRAMQRQIYLLCQQMSRQEQAHRHQQLLSERSQLDACETELLQHVARLEHERQGLLAGAHDPPTALLRHQSRQEFEHCGCSEHQHFADRATPKVRLQVAPVAAEPVQVPDPRRPEWRQRLAELTAELEHTKASWRAAIALRKEWDIERARLIALERRMAEQQIEVERREHLLTDRMNEGQALLLVEAGFERMRDNVFEDEPAQVIADASRLLAELTGDRYRAIQVKLNPLEVSAVNDSGIAIPSQALSRGMLDQVGLCLRLALADEYARRGIDLPLVLDDVLSDSDPDRVDVAIRMLKRAAEQRQIVFLTCQEHLASRFEAAGIVVRNFPGTHRVRTAIAPPSTAVVAAAAPVVVATAVPEVEPQVASLYAAAPRQEMDATVHPSEPHWLRITSPVATIPSVGEQMARRLSAAGVQTIGDLVDLDSEELDLPIASLQIAPAQWRIWQAEGRLLTCVPQLTGRDAQLLAACGIMLPQELAECEADSLVRRIDRLRGDGRSGWVLPGFVWPDRSTVSGWIENGRRARTWRQACEESGREPRSRRSRRGEQSRRSRDGRQFRVDQPSGHRGSRNRRRLGTRRRAIATLGQIAAEDDGERQSPRVEAERIDRMSLSSNSAATYDRETSESRSRQLRFYLELQSPVVDAPSVGPTTAQRLERVGVLTVADLLNRDAQQIADRMQHRRINSEMVREWQDQSRLMCQIPELRAHDAQVLVACGLRDPEAVGKLSPQALFAIVGPFVATKEGQRLLRSAKSPDLAEVTDWITWAQQARTLKAA